ncbi:Ger(x)C family spore germination protein [Virgibacillus salexigens]|uniref:Ger(x)C family spore germination protein n=1 Tax=Virgibacillus massiliensis TaxID=1462526 RepID=UPI00136D496A|nr:Ger(x)C family spore germination protein [Virgibacillus massiliensis]
MGKKHIVIVLSCCIFLTGCWDRVEIEDRGFVIGSAIDLKEKKPDGSYVLELTHQAAVPSEFGSPLKGGGGSKKAYSNISASGESLFELTRQMSTITSHALFFSHMQVLILSEELAKEPNLIANIVDYFIRDHEMRRSIKLVIADGGAKEILNSKVENEHLPALYLESLMDNAYKNTESMKPVHIGEVQEMLLGNQSFVIPKVNMTDKNYIQYKDAAAFQGMSHKMVDSLSDEESKGLNFLTQHNQGGPIKIKVDGQMVAVELSDIKPSIRLVNKHKNTAEIAITIDLEGRITERIGDMSVLNDAYLKKVKKAIEEKVKAMSYQVIAKAQDELHTDILGIGEFLYTYHYGFWSKVKDNWETGENYFSQSSIHVSTDVKIEMVGSADKVTNTKGNRNSR